MRRVKRHEDPIPHAFNGINGIIGISGIKGINASSHPRSSQHYGKRCGPENGFACSCSVQSIHLISIPRPWQDSRGLGYGSVSVADPLEDQTPLQEHTREKHDVQLLRKWLTPSISSSPSLSCPWILTFSAGSGGRVC